MPASIHQSDDKAIMRDRATNSGIVIDTSDAEARTDVGDEERVHVSAKFASRHGNTVNIRDSLTLP